MDERIRLFWLQTSGTGRSGGGASEADVWDLQKLLATISAEEYFNKITRNNQGNVK
tara:strand:- start:741 stop:908 length:168 start_codon:yes stop_codon:yes gene_type:complete